MNQVIIWLTARQVLGRRRTAFLALGALIPAAVAIVFRVAQPAAHTPQEFAAGLMYEGLVLFVLLPLCALILGTSVIGGEIDDGTAVYLLAKPLPRWSVIASKLLVSWLATSVLVVVASAIAGAIALWGRPGDGIILGFSVAIIFGAFCYSCLFVFLSVVTSRALIAGLAYVFIWEGVVTSLFTGTRNFSVREYSLGIAGSIATLPSDFQEHLGPGRAFGLLIVVSILATWFAIRQLQRYEIGETT